MPPRRSGVQSITVIWLMAAGCGGGADPGETVREWFAALARGDLRAAYALTDPGSRDRLAEAALAWRDGVPDPLVPAGEPAPPDAGGYELFCRLVRGPAGAAGIPPVPAAVDVASDPVGLDGDRAEVRVLAPRGASLVHLRQAGGRWTIDLRLPR